jgi:PKD repeat protein
MTPVAARSPHFLPPIYNLPAGAGFAGASDASGSSSAPASGNGGGPSAGTAGEGESESSAGMANGVASAHRYPEATEPSPAPLAPMANGEASAHRSSEPPAAAPTTAPPNSPVPNSLVQNSPAPPAPITLRDFPPDLATAGWQATESGGTAPDLGTVTVVDGDAVLCEGNSFLVTLSYAFTVPENSGDLTFTYANLNFDTTDSDSINDAFEVALVDQDGFSIVPPFSPGRDAFFNIAEELPAALATGVTRDGGTVTVSLADVPAGLQATLIFRLINNDSDTGSCVAILGEGGQTPDAPPQVTVNLVNDTAPSGPGTDAYRTDGLTNDATVSGTVADDNGVSRLEARIDQGPWLDITATLRGDEYTYRPSTLAPGARTITIRATDTAGQISQTPLTFTFNAPPVANAGGSRTTIENSTVQFDASGSTDADAPLYAYRWTFEDVSTTDGPTATHHYPQEGIFPVQLTVIDTAGSTDTDTVQVTVDNEAPVIVPLDAVNGFEGATVTLSAPFTDGGLLDTHIATVDWGDGTTSPAVVTESQGQGTVSAQHVYLDNGVYSVTLTVTDNSQDYGTATTTATIANVAPVIGPLTNRRGNEGAVVTLSGAFADAGVLDTHTATIDWGDGTSSPAAITEANGQGTVSAQHVYADNGVYSVTLTVTDNSQDTAAATATATIGNVAPAMEATLGFEAVLIGTRYHVGAVIAGAFTDPGFDHPPAGTQEQFTLQVDWGDGTIGTADTLDVVQGSPGVLTTGTFTASHTYTAGGTYDVTVTLCDDDGDCVSESFRYGVMLIDIKPAVRESGGSGYDATLPEGLIPVVMFGAPTLDATQITPQTLRFFPGAAPEWDTRLSFLDAAPQDGLTDAVGHFSTWDARIQPTDQVGWVVGQLSDGTPLLGVDLIGVNPASARIPFAYADLPDWLRFGTPWAVGGNAAVGEGESSTSLAPVLRGDGRGEGLVLDGKNIEESPDQSQYFFATHFFAKEPPESVFPPLQNQPEGESSPSALYGPNPANPLDVNADGTPTPLDALLLINALNVAPDEPAPSSLAAASTARTVYLDVTGDGLLTPLDVLWVINGLNALALGLAPVFPANVQRDNAPDISLPAIMILSPADRSELPVDQQMLISGTARAATQVGPPDSPTAVPNRITAVLVNGTAADVVDAEGNFFAYVPILPGENTFDITALDAYGQTANARLTLTGEPDGGGSTQLLFDVSPSFAAQYARTSFDERQKLLYTETAIRNQGEYPADNPFYVGVRNVSDVSVTVRDTAGVTPDGVPYYDFSPAAPAESLSAGGITGYVNAVFHNPNRVPFTYELVFLAKLNTPPAFTTAPPVEAYAGRSYTYDADASDLDGDPLTYSLGSAPEGMSIDDSTGQVVWLPSAEGTGAQTVSIRTSDGRGGVAEQRYTLTVVDPAHNRPPRFTSVPVVDAKVGASYVYQAHATDPDGDLLEYSVATGPNDLYINPLTGLVTWTPTPEARLIDIVLLVEDHRGGTAYQSYRISVGHYAGNNAPVITSQPIIAFDIPTPSNPPQGDVKPARIDLQLAPDEPAIQAASLLMPVVPDGHSFADILIAVDESTSMLGEHAWLEEMVLELDRALQSSGIGPNRYALTGFGGIGDRLAGHVFELSQYSSVALYAPNNSTLTSSALTTTLPEVLFDATVPAEGVYLVEVSSGAAAGDYSFRIASPTTTTVPLKVDQTVDGLIGVPGERDEYTFTLHQPTSLYFDSLTAGSSFVWSLAGQGGPIVRDRAFAASDATGLTESPLLRLLPGNYTLTVGALNATTGPYTFRLIDASSAYNLAPGSPVTGTMDPASETHAYQLAGIAGERFYFDLQARTGASTAIWRLVDPNGKIVFNTSFAHVSTSDVDTVTLSKTGMYTLFIEGAIADADVNTYTFTVQPITTNTVPLELGDVVSEAIAVSGEEDEYTFTLTNPALMYFDARTDNSSLTWTLAGPAGTVVDHRAFTASDSGTFAANPVLNLVAGDYTLMIDIAGERTSPYAFRLAKLDQAMPLTPGTSVTGELTPANETDLYQFHADHTRFVWPCVAAAKPGRRDPFHFHRTRVGSGDEDVLLPGQSLRSGSRPIPW